MRVRTAQITLLALSTVLLAYLVLLAFRPDLPAACALRLVRQASRMEDDRDCHRCARVALHRQLPARHNRTSATVPVAIVVGLFTVAFVLGFSSYWNCSGSANPTFFTPLQWTVSRSKAAWTRSRCAKVYAH